MTRRSGLWWAAAIALSAVGFGYQTLAVPESWSFGYSWAGEEPFCPGDEFQTTAMTHIWPIWGYNPLLWYGGVPAVVVALLVWRVARWRGEGRWGRVTARVLAASLLVTNALFLVPFAVDLTVDRACLELWGGETAVRYVIGPSVLSTLAAVCVLAAARRDPGRRTRPGRIALLLVPLVLLLVVPSAAVTGGRTTLAEDCEPEYLYGPDDQSRTGERAFICQIRHNAAMDGRGPYESFARLPDRELVAYGRRLCELYLSGDERRKTELHRRHDIHVYSMTDVLSALCPALAAHERKRVADIRSEYAAEVAEDERRCRETRKHRPRIRPLRVFHEMVWPEYGILQSFEDPGEDPAELLDAVHRDGRVGVLPGRLMLSTHADHITCLTAETYRRRPPVETEGWDEVVEVGYRSPGGRIELTEGFDGTDPLPDLAGSGAGRYRIRVHYREPDWNDGDSPQHLLVMVYPGKSGKKTTYLPKRK